MTTQLQQKEPGVGLAVAALVLGIVGGLIPAHDPLAVPAGVLAVVFGSARMRRGPGKGMAITGFVLGVLTLVAYLIGA